MKKDIDLIATKLLPSKAFIAFKASSDGVVVFSFSPFILQENKEKFLDGLDRLYIV